MEKKPMLTAAQAREQLLQAVRPIGDSETIPTEHALGRVLAAAQSSRIDVPPLDNTQMDGYAVRSAECASGVGGVGVARRRHGIQRRDQKPRAGIGGQDKKRKQRHHRHHGSRPPPAPPQQPADPRQQQQAGGRKEQGARESAQGKLWVHRNG